MPSAVSACTSALNGRRPARIWLNRFSSPHANSLTTRSPTPRPLPFERNGSEWRDRAQAFELAGRGAVGLRQMRADRTGTRRRLLQEHTSSRSGSMSSAAAGSGSADSGAGRDGGRCSRRPVRGRTAPGSVKLTSGSAASAGSSAAACPRPAPAARLPAARSRVPADHPARDSARSPAACRVGGWRCLAATDRPAAVAARRCRCRRRAHARCCRPASGRRPRDRRDRRSP